MCELSLRVLTDVFGAEVQALDLSGRLKGGTVRAVRAAWLRYGVLLFRRQSLTPGALVAVTRCFGRPVVYTRSENACAGHPEVLMLSSARKNGRPLGAAISSRYWHTDGHYLRCPPAGTLLFAEVVPPSGADTWFADMAAAYQGLPEEVREQINGRTFLMDRVQTLPYHYPERPLPGPHQKLLWPVQAQPVVRTHPETGSQVLYIGGLVPWRIESLPRHVSDELMARLHAVAFQERFCWRHQWQPGDLLMWDNRRVAHKATGYDMDRHVRTLLRTTFEGDLPYYAASSGPATSAS
jgi:taurine dioxygenase